MPKSNGVMMQYFHWYIPDDGSLWEQAQARAGELAAAGITALWLPPASKAANLGGMSMGYDVYDYFDLGSYDQKGSVKTWYGAQGELAALIDEAHRYGLQVYADLVLNHNSGADEQQNNPIVGHNVMFDLSFTRRQRVFQPNSAIDTFELAAILIPHAGQYSLSALARELGIELNDAHRALNRLRALLAAGQEEGL